jgi:hypothetical protein
VDEETRRKRIAKNEGLFRAVNEKIEDINRDFSLDTQSISVVCECGDMHCSDKFDIDAATYEDVRSDPTWFVIVPGHEVADVEEIVARHDGFDVVAKDKRAAEAEAIATDPRS